MAFDDAFMRQLSIRQICRRCLLPAGHRCLCYLGWAWVDAANFARRFDPACRQFFDRKLAQTNRAVATKALACKLSKTAWHIAVHGTDYDPKRMFPGEPKA